MAAYAHSIIHFLDGMADRRQARSGGET
jgi:hypothetical protein